MMVSILFKLDLIKEFKKTTLERSKDKQQTKSNHTKSDGNIGLKGVNANNPNTKSSVNPDIFNLVTVVDEKFDIKNLTNIEEIKDYYEYTENCLIQISKLKMPDIKEIEHLQIDLPDKFLNKKLAIFDLDETLIHCELKNPQKAEKMINIKLPNGNKTRIGLNVRPNIVPALEEIMKHYNMIIYTASDQSYADSVMSYIDPEKYYFKHRLYRNNCVKIMSDKNTPLYIKDLRIIRNIPLSQMIIIDNSTTSFAFHLNNGIPILPFYSNKDDVEMNFLKNYLVKLAKYDDLTISNGQSFNLGKLMMEVVKSHEEGKEKDELLTEHSKSTLDMNEKAKNMSSSSKKDLTTIKTEKTITLNRAKKDKNLETITDKRGPIKKKSAIQDKIFKVLDNAIKGNK